MLQEAYDLGGQSGSILLYRQYTLPYLSEDVRSYANQCLLARLHTFHEFPELCSRREKKGKVYCR